MPGLAFDFNLPTQIKMQQGISNTIGKEAKNLGATKVLLVADRGIINAGIAAPILESIKIEGLEVALFDKVVPNPRDVDCESGAEQARKLNIDLLVAVGGGSSMDTAKAIGTLLTNGGSVKDWCGFKLLKEAITPLIAVPTTAGTGSEVTPFAVITDTSRNAKLNIFDPKAAPRLALLDPNLLLSLPAALTASTGVDALTHAIEAYTCKLASPITDACALYAMDIIYKNLERAVKSPDINVCSNMMIGSTIAGIAFGYSDVGAVHCLAESLGGFYDMPHGVANAIFLPTVFEMNISADPYKHSQVAAALGIPKAGLSETEHALLAADALRKLCESLEIPHLKSFEKVNAEDFKLLAHFASLNVSAESNAKALTENDYFELLQKVYA